MRRLTLPRPSYASVVATVALVIALGGTSYAVNTVGTSDIKNGAVTAPKLAPEAVNYTKLAPDSINSSKIVVNSVALADIKGIDRSGTISFALGANACGTLNLTISNAVVDQAAVITWTTTPPPSVLFSPLQVVSPTQISLRACNVSASPVTVSNAGVRIITLG